MEKTLASIRPHYHADAAKYRPNPYLLAHARIHNRPRCWLTQLATLRRGTSTSSTANTRDLFCSSSANGYRTVLSVKSTRFWARVSESKSPSRVESPQRPGVPYWLGSTCRDHHNPVRTQTAGAVSIEEIGTHQGRC